MKLSQCTIGTLVISKDRGIGSVKKITNNVNLSDAEVRREVSRAIPLIEWSSGEITAIHPAHLEIYKD